MQKEPLRLNQFPDKINSIYKSCNILLNSNLSYNIENKFNVNIQSNKKIIKKKKYKKRLYKNFQKKKSIGSFILIKIVFQIP